MDEGRQKAEDLAARLSIDQQISLLTGNDFWRTKAVPELAIPSIKTTDGPNGARGEYFTNVTPAALFPCGVSLAATWNTTLVHRIGEFLGAETKRRGANVLLAPTICLHRHPLGGRNFESFSEDPYLTGRLATAYINGLQSTGIAATPKHFVCNEQETNRLKVNLIVSERALRELYLKPFEMAVREARPMAIMTAYNALNGVHCDQNAHLLGSILRKEWKFDGLVMSDWGGMTSSLPSLLAGCDLEMPHSNLWRGENLLNEVNNSKHCACNNTRSKANIKVCPHRVKQAIEASATKVLHLIERTRGFNDTQAEPPERSVEDPEIDKIIREAGIEDKLTSAAGIVLLKNERDLLPLDKSKTIAVIGPNAGRAVSHGGGSASLTPVHTVTPLQGIKSHSQADVRYAKGCDSSKWVSLASKYCTAPDGLPGVLLEYFDNVDFQGKPIQQLHQTTTDLYLWDSAPECVRHEPHSFRVSARVTTETTGTYILGFSSVGPGRLKLNGEVFIDNWEWCRPGEAMFGNSEETTKAIYMEAGVAIEIVVESTNEIRPRTNLRPGGPIHSYGGCRIGLSEEHTRDLLQEAVDVARSVDVAIIVVGLDADWESEGYDRKTMDLPKDGSQDRLIKAVVAANPNTVVVNQSGNPVSMPWADKVPAILQAWYQGQEAGYALADVLFGIQSPSGKLPTTFPKRLEHTPAHGNWASDELHVKYEEGIFMGYRHYEHYSIETLFPFGHGLSYTKFCYGRPLLSEAVMDFNETLVVTMPVQNTGSVRGAEIVQAYVRDVKASVPRPHKELKAFGKVFLKPLETKEVSLKLDKHAVGFYDVEQNLWIAEQGSFEILIGASSVDIRHTLSFEVKESFTWIF